MSPFDELQQHPHTGQKFIKKGAVTFTEGPFEEKAGIFGELEFYYPVFFQSIRWIWKFR
jgi:hypothetical protein